MWFERRGEIEDMKKPLMMAWIASMLFGAEAFAQRPVPPRKQNSAAAAGSVERLSDASRYYAPRATGYDDPATAVRRKAAFRAARRMQRIAALRWYGMSNSRPMASSTPWSGTYSPTWTSNTRRPYAWRGSGRTALVIR